jgi:hypothetical protein
MLDGSTNEKALESYAGAKRRRKLNLLAAMSLVLCVATILLWIVSYRLEPVLNWFNGHTSYSLCFSRGQASVKRVTWVPSPDVSHSGFTFTALEPMSLQDAPGIPGYFWHAYFRGFGFAFINFHFPIVTDGVSFVWPCWVIVLATAVFPAACFVRMRRVTALAG